MSNYKTDEFLPGGKPIDLRDPRAQAVWKARWVQDPLFRGVPYREIYHRDRAEKNNSEIRNVHTLFRKSFHMSTGKIRSARLYITADDCYTPLGLAWVGVFG